MVEDKIINTDNISNQDFFGKEVLLDLLSKGLLTKYKERQEECSVLRDRRERYTRQEECDTLHKKQVYENSKMLAKRLQGYDQEMCTVRDYSVPPYYIYCVYFHEKTGTIFGCGKTYNIGITPKEIWEAAWGKEPELPTVEEVMERMLKEAKNE